VLVYVHDYMSQNCVARMLPPADGESGVRCRQTVEEKERNHSLGSACTPRCDWKEQAIDLQEFLEQAGIRLATPLPGACTDRL